MNTVLTYRAYNRLFHSPLIASLETAIALAIVANLNFFNLLFIVSIVLQRLILLYNKFDYVLVSLITACKNKK